MTLIEVVILAGAQCLSPVQEAAGATEVSKVPCAVVIRLDQQTGDVQFTPPAAATDPKVIAMLVKPGREMARWEGPATESPGAEGDAPDDRPTAQQPLSSTKQRASAAARKKEVKNAARLARAERPAAKRKSARRADRCGSYKAVWYTNKEGRRKYRCVRTG